MISIIALLAGLVIIPALLTWAGHRLRGRSAALRGAFWGGAIGYGVATAAFLIAALAPPVLWPDDSLRQAVVYWSLLAGSGIGAAIGSLRRDAA